VDFTGPDDVQWAEVDEPAAGGGVLIEVAAAGVSFADLLQTRGAYQMKVPLPYTPGMDAAGVVRFAPPGIGLAAGQRVAVLLATGAGRRSCRGRPLNYLTALFALARRAHAQPGDTLLVHGAAGGVGTAAIQLRRALGLRTLAVVSEEARRTSPCSAARTTPSSAAAGSPRCAT
jgi:NADPH2:quinone reductase